MNGMTEIRIETEYGTHECETCGVTYSYGGRVWIDGRIVLSREPSAYCYGSPSFDEADLLVMALKAVGVDVLVDGAAYQICSHDPFYHNGDEE